MIVLRVPQNQYIQRIGKGYDEGREEWKERYSQ